MQTDTVNTTAQCTTLKELLFASRFLFLGGKKTKKINKWLPKVYLLVVQIIIHEPFSTYLQACTCGL